MFDKNTLMLILMFLKALFPMNKIQPSISVLLNYLNTIASLYEYNIASHVIESKQCFTLKPTYQCYNPVKTRNIDSNPRHYLKIQHAAPLYLLLLCLTRDNESWRLPWPKNRHNSLPWTPRTVGRRLCNQRVVCL